LWRKGDKTRKPFQTSLQQQYKQMQNPNVTLSNSNSSLKPSDSQDESGGDQDGKAESVLDNEQASPDKQFQAAINSTESGPTEFSTPTSPTEEEKENPLLASETEGEEPRETQAMPAV